MAERADDQGNLCGGVCVGRLKDVQVVACPKHRVVGDPFYLGTILLMRFSTCSFSSVNDWGLATASGDNRVNMTYVPILYLLS